MYSIIRFQRIEHLQPFDTPPNESRSGLCNPQIISVFVDKADAERELEWIINNDPSKDVEYRIVTLLGEDKDPVQYCFYRPPEIRWYTAKEVCEMFNISRARLTQLTDGRIQTQSKKDYSEPGIIPLGAVKLHLTGKRTRVMYNDKAVKILKRHFAK